MKISRISGLVLAVLCCMTLVIAAAGAGMAPVHGQDQAEDQKYSPGHTHDTAPGNMTELQGDTSPPPLPENWTGNWTEQGNTTQHHGNLTSPRPMPGNWTEPGNTTEFQGNVTNQPPLPENWTGNWTEQGNTTGHHPGNLTDPRNWSGNGANQEQALSPSPENEQQQNSTESIIEEFLAWLSSRIKS